MSHQIKFGENQLTEKADDDTIEQCYDEITKLAQEKYKNVPITIIIDFGRLIYGNTCPLCNLNAMQEFVSEENITEHWCENDSNVH